MLISSFSLNHFAAASSFDLRNFAAYDAASFGFVYLIWMSISFSSRSRASHFPTYCDCGHELVVAQSWTERNPGRRFVTCPDYDPMTKQRACSFFRWFDETQTTWQKELILKLKRENEMVHAENLDMRKELSQLAQSQRKLRSEIVMVKMRKNSGVAMVLRSGFWTVVALFLMIILAKMVVG